MEKHNFPTCLVILDKGSFDHRASEGSESFARSVVSTDENDVKLALKDSPIYEAARRKHRGLNSLDFDQKTGNFAARH
jgi:hypothetical protein